MFRNGLPFHYSPTKCLVYFCALDGSSREHHTTKKSHSLTTKKHLATTRKHTTSHRPTKHESATTAKHKEASRKSTVSRRPTKHLKWKKIDGAGENEDGDDESDEIESDKIEQSHHKKYNKEVRNDVHEGRNKLDNEDDVYQDEGAAKKSDEFGDDIAMLHQLHHVTAEGLSEMGDDLMSQQQNDIADKKLLKLLKDTRKLTRTIITTRI